ncbi:MAG: hypothetical protein RLZ04_2519 [Actinomycetota bacterium]
MPPTPTRCEGTSLDRVTRGDRTLVQTWPRDSEQGRGALEPRRDLIEEDLEVDDANARDAEGWSVTERVFTQAHGPFRSYRRTVTVRDEQVHETIDYRLSIPWFGWLFARPVRHALRHPRPHVHGTGSDHWWAPPDRLGERQVTALALLALASMAATFANTLFTQTATFAADRFGVDSGSLGVAGAVVRVGIVLALPVAWLADRVGRRRSIVALAWAVPVLCALGAAAPNFWSLVASQTVARPMGIALAVLAGVAAAEEMPRNSRAYAISVLAMAAGLGAGVAVAALRLADLGDDGWRLVYLLALVWLPVAVTVAGQLEETRRFRTVHRIAQPIDRRRLALIASVALTSNLFIAPASYFQNNYLDKVRGYSGGGIALFTLITSTPASIGLVLGGRLADVVGRRRLIALCTPISTTALVMAFVTSGTAMWVSAFVAALLASMAYPAYAVYRAEMFPTGTRSRANGIVTATALLSGSIGILVVGFLHDHGVPYSTLIAIMAVGQLAAAVIAYSQYPETAHLELEDINPEDPHIGDE